MTTHIFQRTAEECACDDGDMIYEYMKRHEFRLASFNNRDREAMLSAIVEENGITGGWFWMDAKEDFPHGPFETYQEAKADSKNN